MSKVTGICMAAIVLIAVALVLFLLFARVGDWVGMGMAWGLMMMTFYAWYLALRNEAYRQEYERYWTWTDDLDDPQEFVRGFEEVSSGQHPLPKGIITTVRASITDLPDEGGTHG